MAVIRSFRVKLLAQTACIAVAFGCTAALAQGAGPRILIPGLNDGSPGSIGAPRTIVPPMNDAPEAPAQPMTIAAPADALSMPGDLPPDTMMDVAASGDAMPPDMQDAPTVMEGAPVRLGGAVQVGDLGNVEGPVAGTLDEAEGLGSDQWQGSDRASIEAMLASVPPAAPSDTARLLMRKVLLTAAPPPAGRSDVLFNVLRINKLIDAGLADDAADLAEKVEAPKSPETLRAQADAFLLAGRDDDACGAITAYRLDSGDPFWVELRAYCYAVAKDNGPLDLTRSVIEEQGLADPAFTALLDGVAGIAMPVAPETLPIMDSLHIRMLDRLKLPMNAQIATGMNLSATLIAVGSAATPNGLRVAAAEKALRAGVLPTPMLAQILDLSKFDPRDLAPAPALARNEPLMTALARLRAALKGAQLADTRAELIHTAFEIGEREGLLLQVSLLFGDDAAAITPARDWSVWADLMTRGLLLAGRPEAAARWNSLLAPNTSAPNDVAAQLQVVFALTAPNFADPMGMRATLTALADQANPKPPPPPEPPPPTFEIGPDGMMIAVPSPPPPAPPPPPKPPAAIVARATLDLGLFDALGRMLPGDAQMAVAPLMMQQSPGRRPPPVLMDRIDKAALAGARGEVALAVAVALGQQGGRDLAPDIVVRLVRALETSGEKDAAHALAAEALLTRQGGGVGG